MLMGNLYQGDMDLSNLQNMLTLAALRMLNNNPEYFMFTPDQQVTLLKSRQRLIVEFACEDARKLLKQKKNLRQGKKKYSKRQSWVFPNKRRRRERS